MALFLDGPLPLEDTIVYTQGIPLPSANILSNWFNRKEYDTDEIDFAVIAKTNRVAKFRNWDGSYWVAPRDTGLEKRVRLLPLGGQLEVGEYERRQQEYKRFGGTIQQILVDAIYNDLDNLTTYTQNRMELAWASVLANAGTLTINENGVQQQVDYGVPSTQVVTPAGALWSNTATSDPLTDLITWRDLWVKQNGNVPFKYMMSLSTSRQLMMNQTLINAAFGAVWQRTHITFEDINRVLAPYGLPPMTEDQVYWNFFDVDGVDTEAMPENKFLFLPENPDTLGFTAWGTPTTVMELNANHVQVATGAGIIGILVREEQPPFLKRTFVDAVALPVIADPRKMLVATVQ
jgi:hypothetical protein